MKNFPTQQAALRWYRENWKPKPRRFWIDDQQRVLYVWTDGKGRTCWSDRMPQFAIDAFTTV